MFAFAPVGVQPAAAAAESPDLPVYTLRQLKLRARTAQGPATARVSVSTPPGWTGEPATDGLSLRLFGPEGEGKMLVAIGLRPEHLDRHLSLLRKEHPGSVPSPPESFSLPQLNEVLGDRATKYVITGHQLGEMVLIERRGVLVLVATVVRSSAWESVRELLPVVYRSVRVDEAP